MARPNDSEHDYVAETGADHDFVAETGPIGGPSDDRDERLGEAIEVFLAQAETGVVPDPEEFAARYPDLSEDLREALDGLAMVQGLVGDSSNGPGHGLEAGRRVAGYRIVRELGRGGMGVVYEAVHVDLDRPVALKVLGMHAAPDSTGRRRFLNEAKTAAGLHHTHIVPVFDVGQVGGLCYYAMQRIEGSGLDRVVKAMRKGRSTGAGSSNGRGKSKAKNPTHDVAKTLDLLGASAMADPTKSWFTSASARRAGGPMPLDEGPGDIPPFDPPKGSEYYRWVARAGQQAADALAHAHGRGVIHRDIKPSNLLVDAKGTVWVADFGLARRVSDPSMTQTESLIGTPRYMSPEQAVQAPIDTLTDVYSLGATLYEMLALRPPHDGKTTAELIGQIRDKEPSAPRKYDPKLPRDLETIVLKAMGKHKEDRYASAADLADDLGRFLAMEPVQARRISPIGRAWRFARRHPSLAAVSSIAAVAILTTAGVAYWRVVQEKNKAVLAQKQTEKALEGVEIARSELKESLIQNLWREVSSIRQMRAPDVRRTGLKRLAEAVILRPNRDMKTKLRDEAVQLLAFRDIEPKPPLPTGKVRRVAFIGTSDRLVTLADDGPSLDVWDIARTERNARHPIAESPGEERGAGPIRFNTGVMAASGSTVAVVRPGHDGGRPGKDRDRVEDYGARLIDTDTGVFVDIPTPNRVSGLNLSNDGRRLVVVENLQNWGRPGTPGGGNAGTPPKGPAESYRVTLWDPKRREAPIASLALPEPDPSIQRFGFRSPYVAIAPDGRTVAIAWSFDPQIAIWDASDGNKIATIDAGGPVAQLAPGADGTLAAALVSGSNGTIARWDALNQKPLPGVTLHQPFVSALRFSPDGAVLAVVGAANVIELWDHEANTLLASIPTQNPIGDLAFSPDGRSMAATVGDKTRVWTMVDPIGRTRLASPEGKSQLHGLAFGPHGALAATFSDSKTFTASGQARLQCPDGGVTTRDGFKALKVVFDPAGRLIVPNGNVLEFYSDPRAHHPEQTIPMPPMLGAMSPRGEPSKPTDPGKLPDGPVVFSIVSSSDGRTLFLFRVEFSKGTDLVMVRFDEQNVPTITRLAMPTTGEGRRGDGMGPGRAGRNPPPNGPAGPNPGPPPQGRPNPNGGSGPGTGRSTATPWSLALAPSGNRLYAAGDRGESPQVWHIEDGRLRTLPWPVAVHDVTRIAASPDGRTVALGQGSGKVEIVSAQTGQILGTIPAPTEADAVTALVFSNTGELAVGSRSGLIKLWAIDPTGTPGLIVSLPGQQGEVKGLAYAPGGRRLAAGDDSGANIWDLDQVRKKLEEIGLGW